MKKVINKIVMWIAMLILAMGSEFVAAQSVSEEFQKLTDSDTSDMRLLAAYPAEVRKNILITTTHSEALVRLSDLQKISSEKFRTSVAGLNKEDQTRVWNLTRYDELINNLSATKGKSKRVESVLLKYPKDIHADARWIVDEHPDLLKQIESISSGFNTSFQEQQKIYSTEQQQSLGALLQTPEVISLLNDNMRLTVFLGNLYKKDPVTLQKQFDSLSLVVAQDQLREGDELKKAISENPEAASELKKSAEEYANENGYDESEYRSGNNVQVTEYVHLPYPYVYGYPWWYEYNYWHPYPYWYHWGFYYSGNVMIWVSPPSWYYMHWHFHHPNHYNDYPHLTNVYIDHYYYGPRRSHVRNTREVTNFIRRNEAILPKDFKEATHLRADRIREIGQLETDRNTFIQHNPGQTMSKEDFIKERTDNYPALKNVIRKDGVTPDVAPVSTPEKRPMELPPPKIKSPVKTSPKPAPPVFKKPATKSVPVTTPGKRTPETPAKPAQPVKPLEPAKKPAQPR